MSEIKYDRRIHIIGLFLAIILYILAIVFAKQYNGNWSFESRDWKDFLKKEENVYYIGWLIGLVVFIVLWWLRGRRSLVKCFPLFHCITLIFELVVHAVSLVYSVYVEYRLVRALIDRYNQWLLFLAIAFGLTLVVYIVLVYVLVSVPYVLLRGSTRQRAALATKLACPSV